MKWVQFIASNQPQNTIVLEQIKKKIDENNSENIPSTKGILNGSNWMNLVIIDYGSGNLDLLKMLLRHLLTIII